jgi:hypothetical protein
VPSGFNIIVVDGTWTQAKKVARSLPQAIPYVRLMSTGHLAFKAPMRTQSEPDRICTLGAIIQLLSVRVRRGHRCVVHCTTSHFSFQEMGCDAAVVETLSELLMLKAHVVCTGKGLKSNLEHPKASVAVVSPEQSSHSLAHEDSEAVSFYFAPIFMF